MSQDYHTNTTNDHIHRNMTVDNHTYLP
jgi:hypothetical protein